MGALMTLSPWSSTTGTGVAVGRGVGVGTAVAVGTGEGMGAVRIGRSIGVGTEVAVGTNVGVLVGLGEGVAVSTDVYVGYGLAVGCLVTNSFALASTVASMSGVGSTGAGAAVEQASTRIPISTARTTGGFIRIPSGLTQHILLDTAILESTKKAA